MNLQLDRDERDLLLELLKAAHPEMQHELHHTDAAEYRAFLRRRIGILEQLTSRIEALALDTQP